MLALMENLDLVDFIIETTSTLIIKNCQPCEYLAFFLVGDAMGKTR